VKAYLKRSKNDANDAAAICEAVMRAVDAVRPDENAACKGGARRGGCGRPLRGHAGGVGQDSGGAGFSNLTAQRVFGLPYFQIGLACRSRVYRRARV
jgi:hypothetical protein